MHSPRRTGLALCLLSFLLPIRGVAAEGDAGEGKRLILSYGCGSCHAIPGIPGARGMVGPPLDHMGRRGYIAGLLANSPQEMIRWLRDPPAVDASTAMPALGLSEDEARDIAAYLYTLK
jgi:cytochrome c1